MIGKRLENASGKRIQIPNRLSSEFCWSPGERIEIMYPIEVGTSPGFIVRNLDYRGIHRAHETAWIDKETLEQSFKEIDE